MLLIETYLLCVVYTQDRKNVSIPAYIELELLILTDDVCNEGTKPWLFP